MAETTHTGQRCDQLSWTAESFSFFRSIRRPHITFKLPRGDMDTPPCPRNFFRYLAIGMCHFRHLWNGMCDRHWVEITVMQFTGHSLPVHHFVVARWDLHLVPFCQPSSPARFLSITGHWDVSLPLSLEWYAWSSSSGNNCHAVHRSVRIFFYRVSYCQPSCILHTHQPQQIKTEHFIISVHIDYDVLYFLIIGRWEEREYGKTAWEMRFKCWKSRTDHQTYLERHS